MLPIQLTGHNIELTDTLREFVNNKFSRVTKHAERITRIHIVLSVDKLIQKAEATIHIPHFEVYAEETSDDMYKTIDKLIDKLVRQLEKHKEKEGKSRRR